MIELAYVMEEIKSKLNKLKLKSEFLKNKINSEFNKDCDEFKALIEDIEDVLDRVNTDMIRDDFEHKLEFEGTISNILSRFVGIYDYDSAINTSLADIGVLSGASRSYLFLFSEDNKKMSNTHEWCSEGVSPQIDFLQNLSMEYYHWAIEKLESEGIIYIKDVSKIPIEAEAERQEFERENIKSLINIPLKIKGKLSGFIGFDNVRKTGKWDKRNFDLLRVSSQIIANVIERKRAEQELKNLNEKLEETVEERTKELRESEEKYRLISEDSDDLIAIYDENFNIEYQNKSTHSRILGYDSHKLRKKNFRYSIIHKDDFENYVNVVREGYNKGNFKHQIRLKQKDGVFLWFEVRGKTYFDKYHRKKILVVSRDITEIKSVEQKLRESEKNFRNLINNVSDVIMKVDLDGKINYTSPQIYDLFGYEEKELIGYHPFDFIHPEDLPKFEKLRKDAPNYRESYTFEFRAKHKKGHYISIFAKGNIIREKGKVRIIGVLRDVSEQKKAEIELREKTATIESIFRAAPTGIGMVVDREIKQVNNRFCELVGYSSNELIGKNAKIVYASEKDYDYVGKEKYDQIKEHGIGTVETQFKRKDGKIIDVLLSSVPINPKDLSAGVTFTALDITKRKKIEDKLRDRSKKLEILNRIITESNKAKDLSLLLEEILSSTLELMNFDGGGIYLVDKSSGTAEIVCHEGLSYDFINTVKKVNIDDPPYKIVFIQGQPVIAEDFLDFSPFIAKKGNIVSLASIPLIGKDGIIGALNLASKTHHYFSREEEDILQSIGRETGTIIQKILAEHKLVKEREKASLYLNLVDVIVVTLDIKGNISLLNKKGYDILEYEEGELIGKNWFENCIPPDKRDGILEYFKGLMSGEINVIPFYENPVYTKNGNEKLISWSTIILKDKSENIIGSLSSGQDITERRKAEENLRESEEKYRHLFESSPHAIILTNKEGIVKDFNMATIKMFGYRKDEVIGKNYTDLRTFTPDQMSYFIKTYKKLRQGIETKPTELKVRKEDGTIIWINYHSSMIVLDGKILIESIAQDITEKKKAEELIKEEVKKLKELDQIKTDFIDRASHELKTPLNSIYGASTFLIDYYKDFIDDKAKDLLEIIKKGGERLLQLIEDLLDVSQLESGRLHLKTQKENIVEIIYECVNDLRYLAEKRQLSFNLKIQNDYYLEVDKIRFEQVITNLILNAIKNTLPRGIISIDMEKHEASVDILIKDTGVGFTEKEKENAFKKFGKIERYGKGMDIDTEGSGLGLYISKKIVELHHGKIWIESEGRKKGSKVIVKLPTSQESSILY